MLVGDGARGRSSRGAARADRAPRVASRYEIVVACGLGLTLLASSLGLGAVHTVVLLPVAAIVIATACAAEVLAQRTGGARLPGVSLLCFALAGYCLLQCVPLPLGLLERIAPTNADIWRHALDPLDRTRSFAPISLDPGATVREALRWTMYGAAFFSARTLARLRGAPLGVGLVFGAAALLAAVTLAHELVQATRVYGIYTPRFPVPVEHMGPLLNSNNLAGYLNLGAMCGMGFLLSRRSEVPRVVVGLGLALVAAIAVRAASRAGVAALLAGVLLFGAIVLRGALREGSRRRSLGALGLLGGVVASGVLLALLGGSDNIRAELFTDNIVKLRLMSWVRPLIADFPIFGVGRGAFEGVFPAYQTEPGAHIVYTHVEDFPLHWAAEWGVPVALAALVLFAWFLRPSALGAKRSTIAMAATIGVFVLAAQNLLDLGFEIPALPLALAVCAGSLLGDRRTGARTSSPPKRRSVVVPLAVAGAVLAALVLATGIHDVAEDRDRMLADYDEAPRTAAGGEAVFAELGQMIERHPADSYFPLIGAAEAWRLRSPRAMAWLERTLERAPINGRAHLLLAQLLVAKGAREQALLELRYAGTYSPEMMKAAAVMARALARTPEEALVAVPSGKEGAPMLEMLAVQYGQPGELDIRERLDAEALARVPTAQAPRVRLAERRLVALAADPIASPCESAEPCRAFLRDQARALDELAPEGSLGDQLRARELMTRGKAAEADALLVTACQKPAGRLGCLSTRAELLATGKGSPALVAAAHAYVAEACDDPSKCAAAHAWAGALEERIGDLEGAAAAYVEAAKLEPSEDRWLRAANAASRAGMHARAIQALEMVARRRGKDAD
ncbi:MAG TPA: O-antigen ligase family protein, partial [Byssovorax sp.]